MFHTNLYRNPQHTLCFFLNRALYNEKWKNFAERGRPQMTTWRMRIACWITLTTNTHSDCVMHIDFPLHQWLDARVSLLT